MRAPSSREKRKPLASRPCPRQRVRLARVRLGPGTWLPGTVRPWRPRGTIHTPDQHGAAGASGRDGGDARLDRVAWRDDLPHRQTLRTVVGHRVQPLTTHADTGESANQCRRFVLGHCSPQLHGRLVPIARWAPWRPPQCRIQGRHAAAARATRDIGALNLHRPHPRLDGTRDGSPSLPASRTRGTASWLAGGCPTRRVRNDRLSQAAGPLLTQVPHGLRHLRSGRCWGSELGFQPVKPLVKAGMELPAQGVPLFSCTDLLERDNLSSAHGCLLVWQDDVTLSC
jgi:hypothetical protein